MNKWYPEDWHFKIEVLKVGKENKAEECRLGLEPGDTFLCDYETPDGFCPTSFIKIFPVMEAIRCEGDLRYLGASASHEMDFLCPDGAVRFRISGIKQE
jgi:uncharacterized repeat protein (TIGR04076 family)